MSWEKSLEVFKELAQDDFTLEFARALDIYHGKVKGLRNVLEDRILREETMKSSLKLYIRTLITDQLDNWNHVSRNSVRSFNTSLMEASTNMDDTNIELLEILDKQIEKQNSKESVQ